MTTKLSPTPVKNPEMIILNYDLAENLGLNFKNVDLKELSNIFSEANYHLIQKLFRKPMQDINSVIL